MKGSKQREGSASRPKDYESLLRLIHERHDTMSKTYQRISVFLTQNPNDVAVQSVNAIAETCGIHASSFVRFYANEVVNIVEEAAAGGVPIVAISDNSLSPLTKFADILFAVPEHGDTFSRSLAAPMCLAQTLTVAVAARVQKDADSPRIPTVTHP